jgi:hypothetical protein
MIGFSDSKAFENRDTSTNHPKKVFDDIFSWETDDTDPTDRARN